MKKVIKVIAYLLLPFYLIYQIVKTLDSIAKIRTTRNMLVRILTAQQQFLSLGLVICDTKDYDILFIDLSSSLHKKIQLLNILNTIGLIEMETIKPTLSELELAMSIADKNSKFIHKLNELYELTGNKTILAGLLSKSLKDMDKFGDSIFENRLRKAVLKYKGILEKMN